ncbi:MAG: FtsX-like permease family protein [Anaerolineales bacterium]
MRPRWKKLLSDLWDNKGRTLLVVFSIAVGVLAIGVITGAYVIIDADMSVSYAAHNPANLELRTATFDNGLLDAVRNYRQVADAEAHRVDSLDVRAAPNDAWTKLDIHTLQDWGTNRINILRPLEGSVVPQRGEIVLEKEARDKLGVHSGDVLEVRLPDDQIRTLRVVGMALDPATSAADFLAAPLGYIDYDTLPDLHLPQNYNRLYITLKDGRDDDAQLRAALSDIKDRVNRNGYTVGFTRHSKTNEHPLASIVNAVLGILLALGILIVFLSSSLIANTLSALLQQHMRHIGVMKLVGGRDRQILGLYLMLMLTFGVLALLIAVPLGGQGAYGLAFFIADNIGFSLQGYRLVPLAFGVQIIIGLLVPLVAGLWPVLQGTRVTVLQAISDGGGASGGGDPAHPGLVDRLLIAATRTLARRGIHTPRPILISIRNTFRNKRRLALTLFTLTMGGAIFISVFNVRLSLHRFVQQVGNYFLADVSVTFKQAYRIDKVRSYALQVPGVVAVEGWAFANAEILSPDGSLADNINILAPPANSTLVSPLMVAGRWMHPDDVHKIVISESILDYYPDLQVGDSIPLKISGREETWEVVGIFKFVSLEGTLGYTPYEYLSREQNQANRAYSFRIVTPRHDRASQEAMRQQLDAYFRTQGFAVSETSAGLSSMDDASQSLDILISFLLIMALLTASVGSMGLAGTMGMNVLERTREIGIMRAIGGTDMRIMGIVIAEGLFIGLISWGLGALLAVPFSYLLSAIVSQAIFSTPIEVVFTPSGFGLWLLLVVVLSTLASVLPARNAARLTIREVLAYE